MTAPIVAPSNLALVSKTITSATISWNLITSNLEKGYNDVQKYKVYINSGSGFTFYSFQNDPSNNTFTVTGLIKNTTYGFSVSAMNEIDEGPMNSGISTLIAEAPDTVPNVQLSLSGTNVVISWNETDNRGQTIT